MKTCSKDLVINYLVKRYQSHITSGGTVSPDFIFYNPDENLYYGYKGVSKSLEEFARTIVPDVLNSDVGQMVTDLRNEMVSSFYSFRDLLERLYIQEKPKKNGGITEEEVVNCLFLMFKTLQCQR